MSKNLIGVCNNVGSNISKIKVWARSFKKHCPGGSVTLLCADSSQEELALCSEIGINTIRTHVKNHGAVNHERLLSLKDYLKRFSSNGYFISTDVFDVVFQRDPFEKYQPKEYSLYAGKEGILIREEPWNYRNIANLFPEDLHLCVQNPVVNSGVIGGEREALISLYDSLYELCESSTNDAIRDQAGLHVMLAKNQVEKIKLFEVEEAWAVHCAVAGPTQFFESWGFKNKFIQSGTPIPYMEDGVVKVNGETACIVHQFNRCPSWNDILTQPYLY
jgi:hypothetical protein